MLPCRLHNLVCPACGCRLWCQPAGRAPPPCELQGEGQKGLLELLQGTPSWCCLPSSRATASSSSQASLTHHTSICLGWADTV